MDRQGIAHARACSRDHGRSRYRQRAEGLDCGGEEVQEALRFSWCALLRLLLQSTDLNLSAKWKDEHPRTREPGNQRTREPENQRKSRKGEWWRSHQDTRAAQFASTHLIMVRVPCANGCRPSLAPTVSRSECEFKAQLLLGSHSPGGPNASEVQLLGLLALTRKVRMREKRSYWVCSHSPVGSECDYKQPRLHLSRYAEQLEKKFWSHS